MEEGKKGRRDFLKGLAKLAGGVIAVDTAIFSAKGHLSYLDYRKGDSFRNPTIVTEKDVKNKSENQNEENEDHDELRMHKDNLVIDQVIEGVHVKLHGVAHERRFALRNYWSIDELVKNCMILYSEGSPEDMENPKVSNDGTAYFGTVINLCKRYDKPLIKFDGTSKKAVRTELGVGVAGTLLSVEAARRAFMGKVDRRQALSLLGFNLLGAYMASCSFVLGLTQREIASRLSPNIIEDYIFDKNLYSHIIDQRNVKFTDNLLKLIPKLTEEDKRRGAYVLVETGKFHTFGMDYYLKHRSEFEIKKKMYAPTYGLLDNDSVQRFAPAPNGWDIDKIKL